jgi:hypothetical protein
MDAQPDMFEARQARDEALARVTDNAGSWMGAALARIETLRQWRGTSEELRLQLIRDGLPQPHHHNAWGALTAHAVKRHLLSFAGYGRMKTRKSHARRTPIYHRGSS